MRLRDDELIGIRVETEDGRRVGTLAGFVVDTETGMVVQFRVRPKGIIAAWFPGLRELLVAHDQVISLERERMVIRNAGASGTGGRQKRMAPSMSPQPLSATLDS